MHPSLRVQASQLGGLLGDCVSHASEPTSGSETCETQPPSNPPGPSALAVPACLQIPTLYVPHTSPKGLDSGLYMPDDSGHSFERLI